MILQTTLIIGNLEGLMAMIVMIFHLIFSIVLFIKVRRWIVQLFNLIFAIAMGLGSLQYFYSLQVYVMYLDIFINMMLFLIISLKAYSK